MSCESYWRISLLHMNWKIWHFTNIVTALCHVSRVTYIITYAEKKVPLSTLATLKVKIILD